MALEEEFKFSYVIMLGRLHLSYTNQTWSRHFVSTSFKWAKSEYHTAQRLHEAKVENLFDSWEKNFVRNAKLSGENKIWGLNIKG